MRILLAILALAFAGASRAECPLVLGSFGFQSFQVVTPFVPTVAVVPFAVQPVFAPPVVQAVPVFQSVAVSPVFVASPVFVVRQRVFAVAVVQRVAVVRVRQRVAVVAVAKVHHGNVKAVRHSRGRAGW